MNQPNDSRQLDNARHMERTFARFQRKLAKRLSELDTIIEEVDKAREKQLRRLLAYAADS